MGAVRERVMATAAKFLQLVEQAQAIDEMIPFSRRLFFLSSPPFFS
jgi:hypothetical protein